MRGDDSSPMKRYKGTYKQGLTATNKPVPGEPTAGCQYTLHARLLQLGRFSRYANALMKSTAVVT